MIGTTWRRAIVPIALLAPLVFGMRLPANERSVLTIFLTANLEGRFSLSGGARDADDPFLMLARNLLYARGRTPGSLYLDMGNSMTPGVLSRFSYGSLVMDFFDQFDCRATLVSSRDISIGTENLDQGARGRSVRLLSSNIVANGEPLFAPSFEYVQGTRTIGFVGVSSKRALVDIAEQKARNVEIDDDRESVGRAVSDLRKRGVRSIILLSGLTTAENMRLLRSFPDIHLVISGGDNRGELSGSPVSRIQLADGRAIVFLSGESGFWRLTIGVDERISVTDMRYFKLEPLPSSDPRYAQFRRRLAQWKRKYRRETNDAIADVGEADHIIDPFRIANLLRGAFGAEVAVVEPGMAQDGILRGAVRRHDVLRAIVDEHSLFTYTLTGEELTDLFNDPGDLIINGFSGEKIQNYPVQDERRYKIVSTQRVYELIEDKLGLDGTFRNSWKSAGDIVREDLQGRQNLLRDDFGYLERMFRSTIDFYISSFFYERLTLVRDEHITTPPGQPERSYIRWGIESAVDFTVYNRYHQFILTPYIYYIKEEYEDKDKVLQKYFLMNQLRGTFVYNLNLAWYTRPYHKSLVDTVVEAERNEETGRDLRPVLIRETVGTAILSKYVDGRIGVGFEKWIQDPVEDPIYGLEALLTVKVSFLRYLTYSLSVDAFFSKREDVDPIYVKSQIENALAFKLNSLLSISVKHKWYYLYSRVSVEEEHETEDDYYYVTKHYNEKYDYSRIMVSLDLKTDFKVY
ncbi:MAG TPA: hypothetical protein PLE73_05580 [Spirochaetota bacterium]|nr:hypothetical protein [Spirochaetota bacterium]HPI22646.1 hypothetical protein [Spirochaetota bacterium]HPU87216.1 hypothetical protein [Spirochaetota bacterium]